MIPVISRQQTSRPSLVELLSLLFVLLISGCSGQEDQREFEKQAYQSPQGYTETDQSGRPVEGMEDPDDWRTAPFFQGLIIVEPAWPNPALTTDEIRLEVTVTTTDAQINQLSARALMDNGSIRFLDGIESSPLSFGRHVLSFPARSLSRFEDARGLHRVLLFDGTGNIVSYGDILVE